MRGRRDRELQGRGGGGEDQHGGRGDVGELGGVVIDDVYWGRQSSVSASRGKREDRC